MITFWNIFYLVVFKSNYESAYLLYATDGIGRKIFCLVMSQKAFYF